MKSRTTAVWGCLLMDLQTKLENLPTNPGVYLMKNDKGEIIYVGKAINLRNRVRSYFRELKPEQAKPKRW